MTATSAVPIMAFICRCSGNDLSPVGSHLVA